MTLEVDGSKTGFCGKLKNILATTFLSTIFFSLLPSLLLIVPTFLLSGALRAIIELKNNRKSKKSENLEILAEDSGIDASDDDSEDKKPEIFEFKRIGQNLNFLNFPPNTSLAEYLISSGKFPVLITFRDVAMLENPPLTPENTARLQYKKRKIKVMTLRNSEDNVEKLAQSLAEIFEKLDKTLTWIYVFDVEMTALEISENRNIVQEIKKMASEITDLEDILETEKLEIIDFPQEIIIPKKDGIMWFNSKL